MVGKRKKEEWGRRRSDNQAYPKGLDTDDLPKLDYPDSTEIPLNTLSEIQTFTRGQLARKRLTKSQLETAVRKVKLAIARIWGEWNPDREYFEAKEELNKLQHAYFKLAYSKQPETVSGFNICDRYPPEGAGKDIYDAPLVYKSAKDALDDIRDTVNDSSDDELMENFPDKSVTILPGYGYSWDMGEWEDGYVVVPTTKRKSGKVVKIWNTLLRSGGINAIGTGNNIYDVEIYLPAGFKFSPFKGVVPSKSEEPYWLGQQTIQASSPEEASSLAAQSAKRYYDSGSEYGDILTGDVEEKVVVSKGDDFVTTREFVRRLKLQYKPVRPKA